MLLILKYIPGLRLRMTDEIEMIERDVDQFHDEMMGEWSHFETSSGHQAEFTHGVPLHHAASTDSAAPQDKIEQSTDTKT